jgi:DNA-directed RNA polymerase subunit RPC12/RpoP
MSTHPVPLFTRLVASVKFLRMYRCSRCGCQQQGGTERMEVDESDVCELHLRADAIRPNPHHMPVGWGSFSDGIRCPSCL